MNMDMELGKICDKTIGIVRETGRYILEQHRNSAGPHIEQKGRHDFVTSVDKRAEQMLVEKLGTLLPGSGFIAEEGTKTDAGEAYQWVIDPLDGTTNFIHGAFPFAISVALAENRVPVLGVVLELGFNECFYGWKDGGAYLDGKRIGVSSQETLNSSLIATGFPHSNDSKLDGFMDSMRWFMENSRGLRRLGSAATDIAWVACGRYDGFYEYGLHPWDVAAGTVILQEAGGRSTDFSGGKDYIFGGEIISSNGRNHDEFVTTVNQLINGK